MPCIFAQTVDIYRNLQRFKIENSLVQNSLFMEYDARVKQLRHRLKEGALVDEFARRFLLHLGNFSYVCAGLPLPFGHPSVFPDDIVSTVKKEMNFVSFPSQEDTEMAADAVKILKDLIMIGSNPILNKLIECVDNGIFAILIAKTRYLCEVKEHISDQHPNVQVLTPHALRKVEPFDKLFLLGSPSWYPDYVFAAPRCSRLHVICYEWLYQPKKILPLLEILKKPDTLHPRFQQAWIGKWQKSIERFTESDGNKERYENISARLFLLEDDRAVLLEANDTAKAYIVDPEGSVDDDKQTAIVRINVQDLEPGMFILLRIGGGGDYIVEVANEMMGGECAMRRQMQKKWKRRLQVQIDKDGLEGVVSRLQELGCTKANYMNVRNWASERNIKTNDYYDFVAIMSVVGYSDQTTEYWSNAEKILRAHMRAGNEIRNRLLEFVNAADVSALDEKGYMEFELPLEGKEAGKLAAFRILSIPSETYEVPYYKTGQPFPLEDDEWLV